MLIGNVDEKELILRAKNGDQQAFGELVAAYQQRVINIVFRLSGDRAHAEDAAQEAFVRAWQKLASYQPVASFKSWLYRIATNVAIDMLRREKYTVDVDKIPIRDPGKGLEEILIQRQRGDKVRKAVLSLPTASRMVLVLREYEELSYSEIAETLEIPIGTVMSRLNYARKALRERLVDIMEEA
jgi:RNA polymerase sigma-70 factor (ECF subfamily)